MSSPCSGSESAAVVPSRIGKFPCPCSSTVAWQGGGSYIGGGKGGIQAKLEGLLKVVRGDGIRKVNTALDKHSPPRTPHRGSGNFPAIVAEHIVQLRVCKADRGIAIRGRTVFGTTGQSGVTAIVPEGRDQVGMEEQVSVSSRHPCPATVCWKGQGIGQVRPMINNAAAAQSPEAWEIKGVARGQGIEPLAITEGHGGAQPTVKTQTHASLCEAHFEEDGIGCHVF